MEGYEEEWMIQEFHPTEKNKCRLTSTIWNSGLNLGKKIALTGIAVSAAPLVLPPLAVLSAFGVAFAVPFGFYLTSYAVTDKLMSTLFSKPKPPPPPLYENVSGDDEEEAYAYENNALKAKEEADEEDYSLGEEEWLVYDDTCQVFDVSVEFGGEGNEEIQYDGLKDMGEVIVDMYEQDGYEEDAGEYMENDELISDVAYEILEGIREAEEEMSSMVGEDVEAVIVSAEIGWENGTGPQMSMEELERETAGMIASMEKSFPFVSGESFRDTIGDAKTEIDDDLVRLRNVRGSLAGKFVDVEPAESDEENVGVLESLSNEVISTTDILEQLKLPSEKEIVECTERKEPISKIVSEILKGVREAEEEISAVKDGRGEMLGNDVEAVVVSVEVGGENDSNVEQVEEVDVVGPRVSAEDIRPKVKLGNVESIRDECRIRSDAKNHVHSMEKTSPFTSREPVSTSQDSSKDEKLVPIIEDIEAAGNSALFVTPEELEPVREDELENISPKGDEGETIAADVCVRKLVVHTKKSGDNKATSICVETATESELGLLGQDNKVQDHTTQSTKYRPEGIDHNSVDIQDANLRDREVTSLAGASTSKPIKGLNNEDSIWKQINAMRAIVGYEAPQHASCVEELKALYVFTGVEPPASFSEPSSVVDVTEKLEFLMAIVGVKM